MPGTWFPGQLSPGSRIFNNPVVINGVTTMQKGFASYPPGSVTPPGTWAAGAGTAVNTTGYDCMVYLLASTSMGTITVGSNALAGLGTVLTAARSVYVPSNQSISFTYAGTLTWTWVAV